MFLKGAQIAAFEAGERDSRGTGAVPLSLSYSNQ
jgi:hypothetical protein